MAHIARMKVCDRFSNVSENLTGILLAHLVAALYSTEQLTTLAVLHHQVDLIVGFIGLVKFNKIRMVKLFHQIDLGDQPAWLCYFILPNDFDGPN